MDSPYPDHTTPSYQRPAPWGRFRRWSQILQSRHGASIPSPWIWVSLWHMMEMMFVWPPRLGKKSLCPGLWKVMLLPPLLWGSSASKPHYHTVRSWGNMQLLGPWVIPVQAPVLVYWGGHLLAWGKRNSFSDVLKSARSLRPWCRWVLPHSGVSEG